MNKAIFYILSLFLMSSCFQDKKIDSPYEKSSLGGNFVLENKEGSQWELSSTDGKLRILYFGFTYCPDICPTALQDLSHQLNKLNSRERKEITPIFISVDYKRDTPKSVSEYAHYFGKDFVGLTGSEKEIKNVISLKKNALFILDGYHSYCALPFDLKPYEDDLYYMAGAYKYAQAGEGMCFITLPKNCNLRPVLTGWMAEFGNLEQVNSNKDIPFSGDGFKLWGSTLDMTAFLRFNRIWKMFLNEGVSISNIHHHVRDLQEAFLHENPLAAYLMDKNLDSLGHFITFDMKTEERARSINNSLLRDSILTDFRGSRLRFGFGPYLNKTEILQVKKALKA